MEVPYSLSRHSSFAVIEQECPEAAKLLAEYGLVCGQCFDEGTDTIENAAKQHTMAESEMLEMLAEINEELRAQS